jgi:ABC-type branched-subunit amino acid transport system ATPase component
LLSVRGIDAYYGTSRVLSDVSLQLGENELVCILGRNGVGKSTLLKTIVGLLVPRVGTIELDGESLVELRPHRIYARGVAYAPQDNQLFPNLSVQANLSLAVRRKSELQGRIAHVLDFFPALKEKLRVRAGSLSGGQQKFLVIARALISKPRILLLDEPSEGIQPSIVHELGETTRAIRDTERCGILLVEQNRKLAHAVATRCYVIDRGTIVAEGLLSQLEEDGTIQRYLSF